MTRRNVRLYALVVTVVVGWGGAMAGGTDQSSHATHGELPARALTTMASLYQVTSTWTTATEQRIRLGELHGKVQVLAMFYASCEYACPLIVSLMQQMEAALPPELHSHIGFVLITFDPERDTPSALRAYSEKLHLYPQLWSLLHGPPDDVLELVDMLGVKYKKDQKGGFAHANLITVLNKEGEIVHHHVGLHHPLDDTLAAIKKAVKP